MLRWLSRSFGLIVGLVVIYLALMFGASESGEVVQLVTHDADGESVTTRLWVGDYEGTMWLRADAGSGWYQRLLQHDSQRPAQLIRNEQSYSITATPQPQAIDKLNVLMTEKYGLADIIVGALGGGASESGIAVRVQMID